MIKNYIKIAWRNLWKNKLFSFLNIMGLGLGIPFVLLSLMHLQSSFEVDNFHKDADRIYRILTDETTKEGAKLSYATSPFLLGEKILNDYPSIENSTKVVRAFRWELNNRLKTLDVNTIYVEPSFFQIFNFPIQKGSLPLEPNTLVLSHDMAEKFFKEANPIGKTLTHPTYGLFTVTGVLKQNKKPTQFKSDIMVSMASYLKTNQESTLPKSWAKYEAFTFVKLKNHVDPKSLDFAITQIAKKTNENIAFAKKKHDFRKQALADISPSSEDLRDNPYVDKWSDIVFNFSIPLMILLLAGFNYTNLTLARSLSRSKEVGVRKVMGALRSQLVLQFIAEAVIIAFLAFGIGIIILVLMKQYIHVFWLTWEVDNQALIWAIFFLFTLLLGIVAGILPAWILSSFQPVKVLKGSLTPASFGKINIRKSLIVVQFVVTMGFIFQIVHLFNQFKYMATENDNFNRKGILNLSLTGNKHDLFISEISRNKNVEKIGLASMPFGGLPAELAIKANKNTENQASYYYSADRNFIENMKLKFLAGQNLPISNSDSASNFVLLNEKAIQKLSLGTAQEAIGKNIFLNNQTDAQVIGVVQNFCHFNYQFEIQPLVFQYNPAQFNILSIKTTENTEKDTFLSDMKAVWKNQFPYQEMVGLWYEQELYERYYPAEDMKISGVAALVIFVISMMGLLGMVIYSTEKRVKEVGVRKVLGASVWEIVKILSWSFMKLLIIAGIIAIPIGLISGKLFMSIFVFPSGINYGLMMLFFVFVFVFALLTIGYYARRAAVADPVKSLKME